MSILRASGVRILVRAAPANELWSGLISTSTKQLQRRKLPSSLADTTPQLELHV